MSYFFFSCKNDRQEITQKSDTSTVESLAYWRTSKDGKSILVKIPAVKEEWRDSVIIIPKGGSLSKTLGMNNDIALHCAKIYGLKYWYKNGKLFVLVPAGMEFTYKIHY